MLKIIWRFIANFIAEEFVQTWLIPVVLTIGVALIGWVQNDISLFYFSIGVIFSFAAITTGLLRFSEWKFRVTAKDKLLFTTVRARKMLHQSELSDFAISLGFQLRNIATFPIEMSVHDVKTELSDIYAENRPYLTDSSIVAPGNDVWFDDHKIELKGNQWEGTISARIEYGRPGNLNQEITLNKKVFVIIDYNGVVWVEAYDL